MTAPLTAVLYPVEGEPTTVTQPEGTSSYEWIRGLLNNGWLEFVSTPYACTIYLDEEGKLKGLPVNRTVPRSLFAWLDPADIVVGPVVVLGPGDEEGEETPITLDHLKALLQVGVSAEA